MMAFAIVKDGKVLLSGTDNNMDYLASLAKGQGADLYIGDSAPHTITTEDPLTTKNPLLIMGFTFDEINLAQHGAKLQHGSVVSTMPLNAVLMRPDGR